MNPAAAVRLEQVTFRYPGGKAGIFDVSLDIAPGELAVCIGPSGCGKTTIGLLPDADPSSANPFVGVVIATGIGEARNALIARAAKCLAAIGDSAARCPRSR
jgi:energy-coupling factor transporter ATP-binding protein EcfA2